MKHLRKAIIIVLGVLSVFALALFAAACGDSEGGGSNTVDNGGPQTVAYTTEVYLAEGGDYVLSAEKSGTGVGEVGKTITLPAPNIDGYQFNADHANNVTSLTLSANAADNVFRFYYDVKIEGQLVYAANAPRGAAARGSVASTPLGSDGTATAAENGFSITGYRFAGWSYTQNGEADVQPGDTVMATETVTLYAVWDRGYTDRFGGTDYIYVLSVESGKVVLERGETELAKTDLIDGVFTFTLPNHDTLEGKVFSDGTFAYARNNLEGEYTFHTSYYNIASPNGETPPDPDTTLTLDKFGDGTYKYVDDGGVARTERGYITNYSYGTSPEYLFLITDGANAGGGFIFRLGVYGAEKLPVYTTTNGEAGMYDLAITPDGNIFYGGQGFSIQLDGYGTLVMQHADFTGEWEGIYWIEGMYDLNEQYNIYKLHLRVNDDVNGNLNVLTGAVENGVLNVSCYTMPLNDSSYAYVEPNEEAGEYQSADGATLTLDGFKNFADSARYVTENGEFYGSYEAIWSQTDSQLTIVMHVNDLSGMYLGTDITFGIGLTLHSNGSFTIGDTFTVVMAQSEGTPYRLLNSTGFGNALLTIYDEDYTDAEGKVLGKKASYGTVDLQGGYQKLADGYVERGTFGYAPLVTFTRVSLTGEENGTVPKSMICELSATYDSNFFLYDIYFVYSATYVRDGRDVEVKNYTELHDENSEAKIWYMTLPAQGLNAGSLYFTESGTVLAGAFATDDGAYFGPVGMFTVLDPYSGAIDYYYFDLQRGSGGSYAVFTEIDELEYYVYTIDYTGSLDNMTHLIRRGGEGLYSASGDFDNAGAYIRGSIEWVGQTAFGDDIFVLKNGEREELRFVMDSMLFSEPGYIDEDILIYFSYDASVDKTYTAADGSRLILDGFHRGAYSVGGETYEGTYSLSADKKIVYFSTAEKNYTFDISNGLTVTDGIYGTYELYAGGWWNVEFDGHGNATATLRPRTETGVYLVQDDGTVLLFINLVSGVTSYRLQLVAIEGHGEALVYDENVAGTFIGDDWTILYLNGFRSGSYYYPDGVGWTTVYFEILDRSVGFVSIRTAGYEVQNVILDFENKTMSYPEYADRDYIYYAEDLSALIVRESGEIEMNYTSGSYVFANGVYKAFLMDNAGTYSVDLGSMPPKEGPWTVGGKTYYPWHRGQEVTLTGSISVDYGEGRVESKDATLKFTLTGDSVMSMDGVLTYDGAEYSVDLINTYTDSMGRKGLSVVDWTRYDYSPITSYQYQGEGKGTFNVQIAAKELTLYDAYELEVGITSTLTEYRVGFGPLDFADRMLSGNVYVGDGKYLEFHNVAIEATDYFEYATGRRYNAVFTVDGTTYSLQYSKESSDRYSLYLIGTYEKIEAEGGYSVGVIRYFYSNDAYEHTTTQKDVFCDFILYDAQGSIVSFSRAVNADRTSGWYVALGGYDPETNTGYPETIYLVDFDLAASTATVTEYGFIQGAEGASGNYVNLCLDENGEIANIAMLCVDGAFGSVESYVENAENSYTVKLTSGVSYLMTILTDENGDPLTYDDGSWQITLTAVSAS